MAAGTASDSPLRLPASAAASGPVVPAAASRRGPSARGLSRSSQAPASTRTPWSSDARRARTTLVFPIPASPVRIAAQPWPVAAVATAPSRTSTTGSRSSSAGPPPRACPAAPGSRSVTRPSSHRRRSPERLQPRRRPTGQNEPTGPGTCHRAGRRGGPQPAQVVARTIRRSRRHPSRRRSPRRRSRHPSRRRDRRRRRHRHHPGRRRRRRRPSRRRPCRRRTRRRTRRPTSR